MQIQKQLAMLCLAGLTGLLSAPVGAQNVVLQLDEGPCPVPLEASSQVTIDQSGNVTADVDDENLPACFGTPSGTPLDITLTINPTTVDAGDPVNVSWSVAGFIGGVTSCTPSGGVAQWRTDFSASPASGSGTYVINSATTFTIQCNNGSDSASNNVAVNGGTGGGPGQCGAPGNGPDCFPSTIAACGQDPVGRELPFDVVRNGQTNGRRFYDEVFAPDDWPESGDQVAFLIPDRVDGENGYIAVPFVAQPGGAIWRMTWVDSPTNGLAVQSSISTCPGDFSSSLPANCLVTTSPNGAITAIVGVDPLGCDLVAGQIYYWNARHTDAAGGDECNRSVCEMVARPTRLLR